MKTPKSRAEDDIASARPRILDIGCGDRKVPGAIGMDRDAGDGVDVVHDISSAPWPFPAQSFDQVHAHQVLEHLYPTNGGGDPLFTVMREAHRVLRGGGVFVLDVPHWRSRHAVGVPTHHRLYNEYTFEFFAPGRRPCDSLPLFSRVDVRLDREFDLPFGLTDYHLETRLPSVYRALCRASIGRPRNVFVRLTK